VSLNTVAISGRLGRDPELKSTNNGNSVANFSVAVDQGFGDQKTTSWVRCVAWQKTAEFVTKFFQKGDMIILSGRLQGRTWEQDGVKREVLEIVAEKIDFAGEKKKSQSNVERALASEPEAEDPIPF
jgi:single-strand DNA-binding protein